MTARQYLLTVLTCVAALAATIAVPAMHSRPYILSAAAVAAAAWLGGVGPSLWATLLSTVGVTAFLIVRAPAWSVVEAVQALVFVGIGLIITSCAKAQRRHEREARRQGGRLEAVFGQASVGMAIATLDGQLTRVNPRLADIVGRTRESTESLTFRELTHPDDWHRDESLMRQVASGTLADFSIDTRYLRPNGTAIWVHASMSPLLDADGRSEGLITIVEDINERRETEHRIRLSEGRYRSLIDASTAIVWTADPQGRFVPPQESWEASTGQTADQYVDWGWSMVIHPDDRARVERVWRDAIADPHAVDTEARFWSVASSDYRWYSARAVPTLNAAGTVFEWVGACTDIHERRLAEIQLQEREEALRRADQEKDDFLALLAHELRNPLAPIRTAVQLLKLRGHSDADGQRLYAVIDRQVQHMVRMVDDLLDVSRVLRGKVELRIEASDIATVVGTALETSRPLLDAEGQQLQLHLPERPLSIRADQVRLAQVIANLLNNASKYSEPGASITLTAHEDEGNAVIRVTDSGAGIAPDLLPRIFEPFVQADRSLERTRGGLGIGLTLVRRLVELHGGRVSANSRGPGLGSQFEVRLPIVDQLPPAGVPCTDLAETAAVPPSRVLVVDDNIDAADSLAMLLRSDGHSVRIAYNGIDALCDTATWPPDIVILDIGLPGMNGYEVAALLRERGEPCPDLIAVTGYGAASDATRALEAGFKHHLVKPVDADNLQATIAQCVRAHRAGSAAEPAV